jgi:hypothetical protein
MTIWIVARQALCWNYKAQQNLLRELRETGREVPKLNSSQAVFTQYFLDTVRARTQYLKGKYNIRDKDFESYSASYQTTALWSSTDDKGEPLDGLDIELSESAIACLEYDLIHFLGRISELKPFGLGLTLDGIQERTGQDVEQVAHDFWLTRNRHGAGFWDGEYKLSEFDHVYENLGDRLTELAKGFGECNLYVSRKNTVEVY